MPEAGLRDADDDPSRHATRFLAFVNLRSDNIFSTDKRVAALKPSPIRSMQSRHGECGSPAKALASNTTGRSVLGDVSPNVKIASPAPPFMKKAMAGSPLKRSFTAAMEGGEGFRYLKRRRLSDDEALSEVVERETQTGLAQESANSSLEVGSFRSIFHSATEDTTRPDVPGFEETSPTEPNTPSEKDESTQDSTDHKSFSSLINYDPPSQTSKPIFKSTSNAEWLKLRLRVAMFKVRTNQVEIPFLDLEEQINLHAYTTKSGRVESEAVTTLRREAEEVARRGRSTIPKLLPAPILRPTAYSSRMIYHMPLPSSPPVSLSPDRLPVATEPSVLTPRRDVRQLSSPPPDSADRVSRILEAELTSSGVKGRVAEGLLGLRNAR